MLVRALASRFSKLLTAFLASLSVVLLVAVVSLILTMSPLSSTTGAVAGTCIVLGLVWMVIGWLFVPSVQTYIGPGAMKGIPIIWPSTAMPERSSPVLKDLAWRLSAQTDAGIVVAALGFLLMSVGFVVYLDPVAGLAALVVFGAVVAAILVLSTRRERSPAPA